MTSFSDIDVDLAQLVRDAFWPVVEAAATQLRPEAGCAALKETVDSRLLAAMNRGLSAALEAIAAAGRLQRPGSTEGKPEWGSEHRRHGRLNVTEDPYVQAVGADRALAELRVQTWDARGWGANRLVTRTVTYGPWLPAPRGFRPLDAPSLATDQTPRRAAGDVD